MGLEGIKVNNKSIEETSVDSKNFAELSELEFEKRLRSKSYKYTETESAGIGYLAGYTSLFEGAAKNIRDVEAYTEILPETIRKMESYLSKWRIKIPKDIFSEVEEDIFVEENTRRRSRGSFSPFIGKISLKNIPSASDIDIKKKVITYLAERGILGHKKLIEAALDIMSSIPEDEKDVRRAKTLTHELYHYISTRAQHMLAKEVDETEYIRFTAKSGIGTLLKSFGEQPRDYPKGGYFAVLNEGITDTLAIQTSAPEHRKHLCQTSAYEKNMDLFMSLIEMMVDFEGLEKQDIYRDWMQIYFHGWTPGFKQRLQKVFGDNILKELAYLKSTTISEFVRNLREITEIGKGSRTLKKLLNEEK